MSIVLIAARIAIIIFSFAVGFCLKIAVMVRELSIHEKGRGKAHYRLMYLAPELEMVAIGVLMSAPFLSNAPNEKSSAHYAMLWLTVVLVCAINVILWHLDALWAIPSHFREIPV